MHAFSAGFLSYENILHLLYFPIKSFTTMAEAPKATESMEKIVRFGVQLGTALQTYLEAYKDHDEIFRNIAFGVNSTVSALKRLQEVLEADIDQHPKVLTDEGCKEIEVLAGQCGKVYSTFVIVVNKAATSGWTGKELAISFDVNALKVFAYTLNRSKKWSWMEPRVKRCMLQLRWLDVNLLFNLQLASFARFQLSLVVPLLILSVVII
jgi:hypothetical protein